MVWQRRADNLGDLAFVQAAARRQAAGCSRSASRPNLKTSAKDMLEEARRQKIRTALKNMRAAGIRSFGVFHSRLPGRNAVRPSIRDDRIRGRTRSRTSRISIRRCPIPAPQLYEKAQARRHCSRVKTGPHGVILHHLLRGNGLDEPWSWARSIAPSAASTCDRATWPAMPATSGGWRPRNGRRLARRIAARDLRRAGHRRRAAAATTAPISARPEACFSTTFQRQTHCWRRLGLDRPKPPHLVEGRAAARNILTPHCMLILLSPSSRSSKRYGISTQVGRPARESAARCKS